MTFRISFGAVQNPWNLAGGFSAGVTDIFVKSGLSGINSLDSLNLRVNAGWRYHVRVTGWGAVLEQAQPDGQSVSRLAPPQVSLEGTTLVVQTTIPKGDYGYWVTSSVYSPFTADGLLKPTAQVGAANLRTARPNAPVPVDVLSPAGDYAMYSSGVLAPVGQARDFRPLVLTLLGGLGLLLTVLASLRVWRTQRP